MTEMLSNTKTRAIIQEFWNSDIPAIENPEGIKTAKTALKAIYDLELVGKVKAVEKDGKLYLINKVILDIATDGPETGGEFEVVNEGRQKDALTQE